MYLIKVIIIVVIIIIVMISFIVIVDIFFFWVVCVFVCLLLVLFKVEVFLDDEIFIVDILVGKDEVVDEVVDVKMLFDLGCFVVEVGVWNLVVIVVFEIEYIDCVFEDVFLILEVVEVDGFFDGGDFVVWDNVVEGDKVDLNVVMDDVDVDVNDVVENVNWGWIVGDEVVEDINVVEVFVGNVVGMNVVFVLV